MPDTMSDVVSETKKTMTGLIEHFKRNISTLRVGSAKTDFLNTIQVEAYEQTMPLKQVASISIIDNFTLSVTPFDKNNSKTIVKAIQEANLGVGIISEATYIRVAMPKITEERRKEYVKILKKYAEDGKTTIRNARRKANDDIKAAKKNKEISEDVESSLEKEIQKLTDFFVQEIDKISENKEKEILKI